MGIRSRFRSLDPDETSLVSEVLLAGDNYIQHLMSLKHRRADTFWTIMYDRLAKLAIYGPRLICYAPPIHHNEPGWAEKKFDALRRPTGEFISGLHAVIRALSEDTDRLASSYQETDHQTEADDAFLVCTDLAEIAEDILHCRAGWATGIPEIQAVVYSELCFGYTIHWGDHLLRALLTTHRMIWVGKLE